MSEGRRRFLVALAASAVSRASFAQGKVWRIGYLAARSRPTPAAPDVYYDAFVEGMREHGYVEGRNLAIEWRAAGGAYERLPALAAELVGLKPDVLVTHVTAGVRALFRATATIPVVSINMAEPVENGFAISLARPGRNVTGLSNIAADASLKRLELLAGTLPKLSRMALLVNPDNPARGMLLKNLQQAAHPRRIEVVAIDARTTQDIEHVFPAMARQRTQALMVAQDGFFVGEIRRLATLAATHRIPTIFPYAEGAVAGGLMSYGQNLLDNYRRTAIFVDKILKGAKPGDLPIEQPTKIELIVNRRAAKALGVAIPKEILVRADRVID